MNIPGDFGADITLSDKNSKGISLSKLSVAGTITDSQITADGLVVSISATQWDTGFLNANSAHKILIKGNKKTNVPGDFGADITLDGNQLLSNTLLLKQLKVGGTIHDNTIKVMGNTGSVFAQTMNNSDLLLGCDEVTGNPEDFNGNKFKLTSLFLKGTPIETDEVFIESTLAAWQIGKVKFPGPLNSGSGIIEFNELGFFSPSPPGVGIQWWQVEE